MGYYTNYTLTHDKGNHLDQQFADELSKITGYEWDDKLENDNLKWYDFNTHMKEFSKMHTLVVFTLKGVGEESGDLWIRYYKNGKVQEAKAVITYEEFDEGKLK